ncbi:hypothetical protein KUM42_12260 [Modestobacter sp. L9-4]|uniref:hypothetical protein n=1 Tax=Modestobacter sp. L9-4 TaxID=2851567 RepID=UPI001C796260|nr:hypothetical protein [Modestobacter sp. L9-4]QXG74657.1 hypothetical protein KUM42_12260 [Modestobacter sp. L9-4]
MAVLAGCSDAGTANETLPPITSSAAPTSETLQPLGPPDFPLPKEARQRTPEAATAALTYYLELIPRQSSTGGESLRQLSTGCTFCEFLAARADENASAGLDYRGGDITVSELSQPALRAATAEFVFSAAQSAVEVVGPDGQPVEGRGQAAVSGLRAAAAMQWDDTTQAWLMTQLTFE